MKIITEPSIYLLAKQEVDFNQLQQFLDDHEVSTWETDTSVAGEILAEVAGRVCYMSFAKPRPGGNEAYLEHIKQVGHGSVLEHAVYNILITGVSRSFTHELVRHRAGVGYSQLSQRYVDESTADFVVPAIIQRLQGRAFEIWSNACGAAQTAYCELVEVLLESEIELEYQQYVGTNMPLGMDVQSKDAWIKSLSPEKKTELRKAVRSAARSVLPTATETKIFVTANARALRHIIEMRGNKAAELEIRRFAEKLVVLLKQVSPNLFGDYTFGEQGVETPYRKV
jgi:thymidylate synthase (FAD)